MPLPVPLIAMSGLPDELVGIGVILLLLGLMGGIGYVGDRVMGREQAGGHRAVLLAIGIALGGSSECGAWKLAHHAHLAAGCLGRLVGLITFTTLAGVLALGAAIKAGLGSNEEVKSIVEGIAWFLAALLMP